MRKLFKKRWQPQMLVRFSARECLFFRFNMASMFGCAAFVETLYHGLYANTRTGSTYAYHSSCAPSIYCGTPTYSSKILLNMTTRPWFLRACACFCSTLRRCERKHNMLEKYHSISDIVYRIGSLRQVNSGFTKHCSWSVVNSRG